MKNKSQNRLDHRSASRLSKPYALLKTFSEEELNSFAELIKSNYLTDKEEPYLLLKSLRRYALPNSDKFTTEFQLLIFKDMYRDEIIFNDWHVEEDTTADEEEKKKIVKEIDRQKKKLNKAMNDLLKLAETFLKFDAIRVEEKNKENYNYDIEILLPELNKRNQMELYKKHAIAIEKTLNKEVKRGEDYYNSSYKLQAENARLQNINNFLIRNDNFDELQLSLDLYYLLKKLNHYLIKITLTKIYANKEYDYNAFLIIKKLVLLPQYYENILVKLYLLNIRLIENEENSTYEELGKLLKKNRDIIHFKYLKLFYTNLCNYCTRQLRLGKKNYYGELLKLYEEMHYNKIFVRENLINIDLFKNIITICCINREFKLANNWLKYYINFIPKKLVKGVYAFNNAVILFNKNNYKAAHQLFAKVASLNKINLNYEADLKIFILKCLYEASTDYNDKIKQSFESTKSFFRNKREMSAANKKLYQNFTDICLDLYKIKNYNIKTEKENKIKEKLPQIINKLSGMESVYDKNWIDEKIDELKPFLD